MIENFCLWHGISLEKVTELMQDLCNTAGMKCEECEFIQRRESEDEE